MKKEGLTYLRPFREILSAAQKPDLSLFGEDVCARLASVLPKELKDDKESPKEYLQRQFEKLQSEAARIINIKIFSWNKGWGSDGVWRFRSLR